MYTKKTAGWIKHLDFILIDLICMHLAFILSYMVRRGISNPYGDRYYLEISIILSGINFLTAVLTNSYKNILKRGFYSELIAVIKHVAIIEAGLFTFLFASRRGNDYSRIIIYLLPFIYIFLTFLLRCIWKKHLIHFMNHNENRSMIVVTTCDMMQYALRRMKEKKYNGYNLTGIAVVDKDLKGQKVEEVPVVADGENVIDYVCRNWVDEVMIIPSVRGYSYSDLLDAFNEMGIVVHIAVMQAYATERKQQIERMGGFTVITTSANFATPVQKMIKRVIDILGSIIGCAFTLLICLIFGPLIYIQSPGPLFFTQIRVGENGRRFKLYKLRTMYPDAEARKQKLLSENRFKDGFMFKMSFDPRVIGNKILPDGTLKKGIGSFLRETSLDEFPQMLNVLKGDMSLVGTRPPTVDEWEKYEPRHRARLSTKPGITGLWQVSGRSNITDFDEVVRLDTRYINDWSLSLDLKIIGKTLLVLFKREGAM